MTERGTQGTLIMIAIYVVVAATVLGVTWMRTGRADQAVSIVVTVLLLVVPVVAMLGMLVMPDRRGLIFFGGFWAFFVLPFVAILLWHGPQAWISSSASKSSSTSGVAASADELPKILATQPMALRKGAESSIHELWSDRVTVTRTVFVDEAVAEAQLQDELRNKAAKPARLGQREGWIRELPPQLTIWASREGRERLDATAPDETILRAHFDAIDAAAAAASAAEPAPAVPSGLVTAPGDPLGLATHWRLWIAGLACYTVIILLFFFRGSSIATTYGPDAGVAALPAHSLQARLLALNKAGLPIKVSAAERPDEVLVDWDFDDATWLDLARVRHVNRAFRYRLRLDENDRTVRVLEYSASFDVSAGWDGTASLNFQAQRGITFFERSSETVFGLQLGRKPGAPPLHYTWNFDVDEMRIPVRETVTASGWTWKQVMLIAPWLTG